ncbi:dihydrodipicolinate synthase family protein [Phytohabitans kaempferiae]|uniref:Dihydrodipicolinate synthase family protein n=1 Tax=Phytohabitans kaempferiae TaxID=1620943 RepID=A0ABV6MB12_9ACTN
MIPADQWRGYWPAATTPFAQDGRLDLTMWREQLDLYQELGVHGVLVNGSSGEWYAQTSQERRDVARVACEHVNGVFPVVVGVTGFTPDAVIDLGRAALADGADGILFTPPPYARPTEDEIYHFYREVAEAVDGPIMVYNWPRGTAVNMSTDLIERLVALPQVVAVKDSTPKYGEHLDTLARLGSRSVFFANYITRLGIGVMDQLGGQGSIEGGALAAQHGVPFFEAYWKGEIDVARVHADRYDAQQSDMIGYDFVGLHGSQISQIKAAMRMLGQPGGWPRRPLRDLDEHAVASLRTVLERHGLL